MRSMKSIRLKLWTAMMILIGVVLVLLWLFQVVFLNNFYTSMKIKQIESSGIEIAQLIRDKKEFTGRLDELAYNNNLTAELVGSQLNTIYIAGTEGMSGQMPMMRNSSRLEAYEKALKGETVHFQMTHPRFGSSFMLIGVPATIPENTRGVLFLTLPLAPVEDTVQILKNQLLIITIILLISALALSFILSRSFTKPILEITRVTRNIASGDFSAEIDIKQCDEIGKLAETINYMGKELSKTDQLRKDLIANVSHELRTPLSLIKGYAETIRDISGDNREKRERHVGIIIEEADRLSNIVKDILGLSRLQSGSESLAISEFKLDRTLDRVIGRFEILSENSNVMLNLSVTPDLTVRADESKIEQTLYNLINNAFNHTPDGGSIAVRAFPNEEQTKARIEISDTGAGIPSEELPYIWERFYKADKSGKRGKSGTGLGLAIVKSILEKHEAGFGVESRLSEGSTFWFELKKV